ncbi:MAG: type II toxin-antitoxin system VapC family toxin [Actinomycetota bacterium]|nr:type II toxin-antitoxin system VapC family toxin [Actinomycetota bacterium]
MTIAYLDSSALVKLVVDEDGSDLAGMIWDGCDAAFSSRLAYPEVHAALAAAARNHQLTKQQYRGAQQSWKSFWSEMRPVELTKEVEREAGRLAGVHSLGGADAVHLASALAIGATNLLVAAWDRRLRAGASAVGLAVAPA